MPSKHSISLVVVLNCMCAALFLPVVSDAEGANAAQLFRIPPEQVSAATDWLKQLDGAQQVYYESNRSFGTVEELVNSGLLEDSFIKDLTGINSGFELRQNFWLDHKNYSASVLYGGTAIVFIGKSRPASVAPDYGKALLTESLKSLVSAQAVHYAKFNQQYGTMDNLLERGFLNSRFPVVYSNSEVVVYVLLELDDDLQGYRATSYVGPDSAYFITETGVIEMGDLAILESARDRLRSLVTAEARHYAHKGEYAGFNSLVEEGFVGSEYDSEFPEFQYGIRLAVVVARDGQSYQLMALINDRPRYVADEGGEIRDYDQINRQ